MYCCSKIQSHIFVQVLTQTTVNPCLTQVKFLDVSIISELIPDGATSVIRRSRRSTRYSSSSSMVTWCLVQRSSKNIADINIKCSCFFDCAQATKTPEYKSGEMLNTFSGFLWLQQPRYFNPKQLCYMYCTLKMTCKTQQVVQLFYSGVHLGSGAWGHSFQTNAL